MSNPELDKLSQPTEQKIKIELVVNDLNIVLGALQELPHRVADPVLKRIMVQAQAQVQPPQG